MTKCSQTAARQSGTAKFSSRRIAHGVAGALALGLAALAAGAAFAGDLCNNTNGNGVLNNPQNHRTPCVISKAANITQLITYHWNNGQGAKPGTILLFNPNTGQQWGPFTASGSSGQGSAPNVNWTANVNLNVPAGSYQIIDSDPATWSWNPASGGYGFAKAEGAFTTATPSPVLPPPSPSPTSGGSFLCDNSNTAGVQNDPWTTRTPCMLHAPSHITQLITYHWNNGQGAKPGTLLLFNPNNGQQWGPYQTTGSSGQASAPSVNWTANVNLTLPAGCYEIIDSDSKTWSWNQGSRKFGFAKAAGSATGPVQASAPDCPGPYATGGGATGGSSPPPPAGGGSAPPGGGQLPQQNPCHANSASFVELARPVCFGPPTTTVLTLYVSKNGLATRPTVAQFRSGAGYNYISNQLGGPMNTPGLSAMFSAPLTLRTGNGLQAWSTYTFTIPPGTCFSGANHIWWFDIWVPGQGDIDAVAVHC
jgi:hypothetical protein